MDRRWRRGFDKIPSYPCAWQQWAGEGGHSGRPAGLEGDAKLQAIMPPARRGISCRSKTPTLVEHNSRSEGKFGPYLSFGSVGCSKTAFPEAAVRQVSQRDQAKAHLWLGFMK